MAGSTDSKRLALWRGRFRRFEESRLTVVRFCEAEGVSLSAFYYWRKRLERLGLGHSARTREPGAGERTQGPGAAGGATDNGKGGPGVFKPVAVVPAACGVVVRLPGGVRIEVDASQLDAIQAVVAATVRGVRDGTDGQSVATYGEGAIDGGCVMGRTNGKGNRNGAVSC